jgi:hypothetical protein
MNEELVIAKIINVFKEETRGKATEQINKLEKSYNLHFNKSGKLILTNLKYDTITFSNGLINT